MSTVDVLLVNQFLNWNCFEDAITLAEILFCQESTDQNAALLAKCFYNAGEYRKSLHLLGTRNLSNLCAETKLLMANCSFQLGRYDDVERIFGAHCHDLDSLAISFDTLAIPIFKILADSYRKRSRLAESVECYRRCFLYAPYMISAFQCLCEIGDEFVERYPELLTTSNVKKVLTTTSYVKFDFKDKACSIPILNNLKSVPVVPDENIGNHQNSLNRILRHSTCKRPSETIVALAPRILSDPFQTDSKANLQQRRAKVSLLPKKYQTRRLIRRSEKRPNVISNNIPSNNEQQHMHIECSMPNLKKQRATEFGSRDSIKENTKVPLRSVLPSGRGPTTRLQQRQQASNFQQPQTLIANTQCTHSICRQNSLLYCCISNSSQILEELVKTLCSLFAIYFNLKRYEYSNVVTLVDELPRHFKKMHWALIHKAESQTELGHFTSALTTFKSIRLLYPMHLESMAIYSTALWHIKAEHDLVNLAQVLADIDMKHPSVLCAIGNHFSLMREHECAIKLFKRAIQIDPYYRTAYALLGNEYMVSDNHEQATSCFRVLINLDLGAYRAWYGLGSICFSREKYNLALLHFERALALHTSSAVLMCHVAVTQHVMGFTDKALKTLTKAVTLDPSNSLCRFHRAGLLYSLRNFQEALKELQIIEELVPNESLVFHMLAKVYRKMKNEQLFLTHVSWAMKLDAKGAHNTLKDTIDRFYSCEDDHGPIDNSLSGTGIDNTSNAILSMSRMFRSTPLSTIMIPSEEDVNTNVECFEHMTTSSDGELSDDVVDL